MLVVTRRRMARLAVSQAVMAEGRPAPRVGAVALGALAAEVAARPIMARLAIV